MSCLKAFVLNLSVSVHYISAYVCVCVCVCVCSRTPGYKHICVCISVYTFIYRNTHVYVSRLFYGQAESGSLFVHLAFLPDAMLNQRYSYSEGLAVPFLSSSQYPPRGPLLELLFMFEDEMGVVCVILCSSL